MRLPNLNLLRAFDAAARKLNFRLAAEELHVTQGAVAQQIRRLEADLGVALFRRLPRGVALSAEGRRLHARIGPAMAEIAEATAGLAAVPAGVTISVPPSFAAKWLVHHLPEFADRHPDIAVRIEASEGLSRFGPDGVDLAIRQGTGPFGRGLHAECLAPLNLCAVASPSILDRPVRGPGDCAGLPVIEDGHRHWERTEADRNGPVLQVNQTALAIDAAIGGQGIALAPRLLIEGAAEAGLLVILWQQRDTQGGYHLVWPSAPRLGPAAEAIAGWLRNALKGQAPR